MVEDQVPDSDSDAPRTAAIGWWTRLDAGALSPQERAEFSDWLTRSPEHKAAFDDICALWGDLEELRSLYPPPAAAAVARPGLRRIGLVALVASLLMLYFGFDDLQILLRARERTGLAETKQVTLEDGSRVELGPRSAIAESYDDRQRSVTLLRGEAYFEVAPDAGRPFSVSVAGGSATALGTAFDVSTNAARTEVTVLRHRVRIASAGAAVVVSEGEQSAFAPGIAAIKPYAVAVDHVTAWRRGKLIFDDRPLGEVVEAIGQYYAGYILILDPRLKTRRVTGVFDAGDPMAALRAIERSLGISAIYLGGLVALRG
ncbi:MAG TPA: FecR family protein [Methylocystis sp.]|nr:FecR family protein [Methylocystis sp.]